MMICWSSLCPENATFEILSSCDKNGNKIDGANAFVDMDEKNSGNNCNIELESNLGTDIFDIRKPSRTELCKSYGVVIDMENTCFPIKYELQDAIKKAITIYERRGYFYITFGLCINCVWVALLHYTKRNVAYIQ